MNYQWLWCCLFLVFTSCENDKRSEFIDWQSLQNPVYSHAGWSTKDACMIYHEPNETFYLFFSAFYFDEGRERCHVVGVKTKDFKTFSESILNWRGKEGGWIGMASPDIQKIKDTYILTYNSWGDKEGQPNQLFYATSKDLETWKYDLALASNLTKGIRAIDAAIAYDGKTYILVYKERQTPVIAWADSLDSDRWQKVGVPNGDWFENSEFLHFNGKWHLLATARGYEHHVPRLATMVGDGDDPNDWLTWTDFKEFRIPTESFNTNETANAAFLADWRTRDGYFYLLYAGRTEDESHLGRGNNKLALARSSDLNNWSVPPQVN
jgi:predicted GH43/DUF377 family glycosyl hydrolase